MAERIVGIKESDWPAVRDAVNMVRRGGIEHPFHRRRQPVVADDSLFVLVRYTGTDTFLGNDTQTGVTTEGQGVIVDGLVGGDVGSTGDVDINALYLAELIAPDGLVWARRGSDAYYAVAGAPGVTITAGTVTANDTVSVSTSVGPIEVLAGSNCAVSSYVEGQVLLIAWDRGFHVLDECCPPGYAE